MASKTAEVEVLAPEILKEIDLKINTSLTKANITEAIISKLKEDYLPLTIKGQQDKEGYMAVVEARKTCKKLRVEASKLFKAGRAEANAIAAAWIAKEKDVTGQIGEIETHLEKMEDDYDLEKERQKVERDRQIQERAAQRMAALLKTGASLQGSNWVLGDLSYEAVLVSGADEEDYMEIYNEFHTQYTINEKLRIEKEQKEENERQEFVRRQDKLEADRQELERRENAFKEQQESAEQEKSKAAREKMKAEQNRRMSQMQEFGLKFDFSDNHYKGYDCFVSSLDITGMDQERWDKEMAKMGPHIEEHKKRESEKAEEKRLKDIEEARIGAISSARFDSLKEIGFTYPFDDLGTMSDSTYRSMFDEHNKAYQKKLHDKWVEDKKEEQRLEKEKEKERQELMGEKQKYEEMVAYLKGTKFPEFKSGQYRAKANIIRDFIDGLK